MSKLERYDFLSWFDYVLVSGRVGMVKPELAIYRQLAADTGIDLSTSVFIDDSAANVDAPIGTPRL